MVLDAQRRRDIIRTEAKKLAFAQGLELIEDDGLLAEVAGLVEWPVVLMGSFAEQFLHIPAGSDPRHHPQQPEMFRPARRRARQAGQQIHSGRRTWKRNDGGKAIIAGNERVIRARLSDAKFFYDTDLKTRLEDRLPKFKDIVFHEKLGSQWPSASRASSGLPASWRRWSARMRQGRTCAALVQGGFAHRMVGEFPELQGTMGKYYAEEQGEDEAVAHAMRGSLPAERPRRSGATPIRSPLPSHWPTRSTRWSAFGRSTKSRPARKIHTPCAERRLG